MTIKQSHEESHGLFYVDKNGKHIAQVNYIKPGTRTLVITNTDIDKEFKGQNIGSELVKAVVDYARDQQLQVRSFCPYAEYLLEHDKNYRDVYKAA